MQDKDGGSFGYQENHPSVHNRAHEKTAATQIIYIQTERSEHKTKMVEALATRKAILEYTIGTWIANVAAEYPRTIA
jgi:hypothetical protein